MLFPYCDRHFCLWRMQSFLAVPVYSGLQHVGYVARSTELQQVCFLNDWNTFLCHLILSAVYAHTHNEFCAYFVIVWLVTSVSSRPYTLMYCSILSSCRNIKWFVDFPFSSLLVLILLST
jgi:hypothetical protein